MRLYRKTFEVIGYGHDSIEEVQGLWVPWCVEHDERGIGSSWCNYAWMSNRSRLDCRWHPQGAFIPAEGGTT